MNIFTNRISVFKCVVGGLAVGFATNVGWAADGSEAAVAEALPEITADAGLDVLQQYAALNNSGLKARYQQWQAAVQMIPQATALPDPRLSYGYFVRPVETRVGPQNHRLGITQMLPWFGKLKLRGEKVALDAEAVLQRLEGDRLALFYNVAEAYQENAYLHRAIEIVDENISLMKQLEGVAQAKFQGGGSYLGVVKAQVELGKLEDRKRSLADVLEPVRARLNAALSRDSNAPLPAPKPVRAAPLPMADSALLARLADANPELMSLAAGVAREDKGVALARREFYPDVTLGVDYVQTGSALLATTPGNGKDPVVAMFSINIPLWQKKLRAGVKAAEARKEAVEEQKNDLQNRLQAGLKLALFNCRDAERKIALYRDSLVPQARSALAVAQKAFEGGQADFLETVDAQRLLLEFQLQAERSLANREQRIAEIRMMVGEGLGGSLEAAIPSASGGPTPATRSGVPGPQAHSHSHSQP